MSAEQYGLFGVIFSAFLLLAGLYNAFFLEPISVIGPTKWSENIKSYYFLMIILHIACSLLFTVFLLVASLIANFFAMGKIATSLQILAVASPFILFFWLMRRMPYLENKPAQSLSGTIIYAITVILLLILFANSQAFRSVVMAFTVLVMASLVAGLILASRIKLKINGVCHYADLKRIIHENYTYGKWAAAASVVSWLSFELYYILTASLLGLEETGAYKALQILISPLNQIITAFVILILPWFSKRVTSVKVSDIKNNVRRITLVISGIAIFYSAIIVTLGDSIIRLFYGGRYLDFSWLLPYLTITTLVVAIGSGSQIALRAFQLTRKIFLGVLCSAVATVTFGIYLTNLMGIKGVAIGGICTAVTLTATLTWMSSKYLRRLDSHE